MSEENSILNLWKQTQATPAESSSVPEPIVEQDVSPSPLESLERQLAAEPDTGSGNEISSSEPESSELSTDSVSDSLLDNLDSAASPEAAADIEYVRVTDESGRKRKVKVDYSDKQAIQNAYKQAAGMRKFQTERDTARKDGVNIQKKFDELNDVYGKLNSAWEEGGVKAVVNLLGQSEDSWEAAVKDHNSHNEYLANLSGDERLKLKMKEQEQTYQKQLEQERKKREQFESQFAEKEEQAALQSLESRLHPAFDRYRFSGKLGDPVIEHQFDEAVWNKVTQRLTEYPDDIELTQAIIDKEFRTVANNFRKMVSMQTEKKVRSTIEDKKSEAARRTQVVAKKGLNATSDTKKFVEDIRGGNLASAWNSFMTGKVKL